MLDCMYRTLHYVRLLRYFDHFFPHLSNQAQQRHDVPRAPCLQGPRPKHSILYVNEYLFLKSSTLSVKDWSLLIHYCRIIHSNCLPGLQIFAHITGDCTVYWGKSTAVGHRSTVLHDKLKDNKVRVIRKTKDLKEFQSFYDS